MKMEHQFHSIPAQLEFKRPQESHKMYLNKQVGVDIKSC